MFRHKRKRDRLNKRFSYKTLTKHHEWVVLPQPLGDSHFLTLTTFSPLLLRGGGRRLHCPSWNDAPRASSVNRVRYYGSPELFPEAQHLLACFWLSPPLHSDKKKKSWRFEVFSFFFFGGWKTANVSISLPGGRERVRDVNKWAEQRTPAPSKHHRRQPSSSSSSSFSFCFLFQEEEEETFCVWGVSFFS